MAPLAVNYPSTPLVVVTSKLGVVVKTLVVVASKLGVVAKTKRPPPLVAKTQVVPSSGQNSSGPHSGQTSVAL